MHLQEARLCLDCEELHTEDQCPRCASDAFAFLTRWVPANERRARPRRPVPAAQSAGSNRNRWLTGAAGVAAFAAVRWLFSAKPDTPERRADPDRSAR